MLSNLAEQKVVVDLTNPEENVLEGLIFNRVYSIQKNDLNLIDQYINIKKIESASFVSMNSIYRIPKEIFKKLHHLKELSIGDYFSYLDTNNFEYLKNLKVISFLRGVQEIKSNAFNGLNNLVFLNLNYCHISYLESGCFNGLINLKYLILKSNQISEIREEIFSPLENLIYLNINGNPLKFFNANGLENLRYLNINCPFSELTLKEKSTENLNNLEVLVSSKVIVKSKKLKVLYLDKFSNENCEPNDPNAFKELEYLQFKYLNLLNMRHIDFFNHFNFESLKVLIGSFEEIPKFGPSFFNLKYLKLYNVKQFNKNCFENFQNLDYLKITLEENASFIENIEPDHFTGINQLKYFQLETYFMKLPDLSAKESIFENLFNPDEKLSKETYENLFMVIFLKLKQNYTFYLKKLYLDLCREFKY